MAAMLSERPTQDFSDTGRLILRLTVAIILLFHGVFKITHGVAWMAGPLGAYGLPSFLAYGVYVAEVLAPILLIIGYRVRFAALLIVFDMWLAFVLVLKGRVFTINEQGGGWAVELEASILLASVAIYFLGPGRYAIVRSRST